MKEPAPRRSLGRGPFGPLVVLVLLLLPGTAPALVGQEQTGEPSARPGAAGSTATRAVPLRASITVDGDLSEAAWTEIVPMSGFIQQEPVEGGPAEHDTEVRVLFDDEAVYVGLRMWDPDPESIRRQLYRRDGRGAADQVRVSFDPNRDRRTGYQFGVSAANVQRDAYLYDDNREDDAWDAVWSSQVTVDDRGWTAELRIPLSQIRYEASDEVQSWGFNVRRERVVTNERSYLHLVSRLQQGQVSQFGLLDGVAVPDPPMRLEALPYAVTSLYNGPAEAGDPFFDGTESTQRVGVDLSYGLGSSFTLDATLNPDFGQVEADPAVINLSAFETFFREQRPFFVEDARIFDFGLSGGRNSLFYSRRIGRSPQGGAPDDAVFSEVPDNATILGAAKLAGRTTTGLSVGALAAVTDGEGGRAVLPDGSRQRFLVEPRSTFGVVSLQQDFNEGASNIGGIVTGMRRELPGDGSFDFLPGTAYNAGLRFEHQWDEREWALWGFFAGSHVRGSENALLEIQTASNHYFQRPDATRLGVDSTATALSGAEWRLQMERRRGDWTGAIWAAEVTDGFEINDVGFSQSAERLDAGFRVGYREIEPGDWYRSYNVNFSNFHNWSHEALDDVFQVSSWHDARLRGSYNLRGEVELANYWEVDGNLSYSPEARSRSATRGGPVMVDPASLRGEVRLNTDRRKALSFGLNLDWDDARRGTGGGTSLGGSVNIQPSDQVEIRLEPRLSWERDGAQYVTTRTLEGLDFAPTYGSRFFFADLERQTFSMETRLDWIFTPDFSLQLFAQPLLSSGDYRSYKQLAASESFDFRTFQTGTASEVDGGVLCSGGSICRLGDDQHVDVDGDGRADLNFEDQDFNIRSLVGNAVLRWEYRPGSTVFLVWQRSQAGSVGTGTFDFGRDLDALFAAPAEDRFILKVNYWLGL